MGASCDMYGVVSEYRILHLVNVQHVVPARQMSLLVTEPATLVAAVHLWSPELPMIGTRCLH